LTNFVSVPCETIPLTAPPKRLPPEIGHMVQERRERPAVGRDRIIVEVASHDLAQPSSLEANRLMHPSPQLPLDVLKLGPHAVTPGFPLKFESTSAGFAADVGEAQKREGLRFAETTSIAVGRCETTECDQAGLVRMKRQRECP